jgi:hypothetical protein
MAIYPSIAAVPGTRPPETTSLPASPAQLRYIPALDNPLEFNHHFRSSRVFRIGAPPGPRITPRGPLFCSLDRLQYP